MCRHLKQHQFQLSVKSMDLLFHKKCDFCFPGWYRLHTPRAHGPGEQDLRNQSEFVFGKQELFVGENKHHFQHVYLFQHKQIISQGANNPPLCHWLIFEPLHVIFGKYMLICKCTCHPNETWLQSRIMCIRGPREKLCLFTYFPLMFLLCIISGSRPPLNGPK